MLRKGSSSLWELLESGLKLAAAAGGGVGVGAGAAVRSSLQQQLQRGLHHGDGGWCRRLGAAAYSTGGSSEAAPEQGEAVTSPVPTDNSALEKKKHKAGLLPSLEDLLFYTIAEGQEKIPIHKFITVLKSTGLRTSDPRLKECMDMLRTNVQAASDGVLLDKELFKKCVGSNIVLLTQAFRRKFVIPEFEIFTSHIDGLYEIAKRMTGGKVADYIPQLAKFSPDLWGVSLCTVDGQRPLLARRRIEAVQTLFTYILADRKEEETP